MSVKTRIQPHIMCGVGDVAKYVLLPGDPGRVVKIASFLDEARKVSEYRGFVTYTGRVGGIEITACSSGIGCPSLAIVVSELMKIGGDTLVRVGTTGSLRADLEVGDLVIATAAARGDGASRAYAPIGYPAVADLNVVSALRKASEKVERKTHMGVVYTSDTFYDGDQEILGRFAKAGAISIEMECATLFTLAGLRGNRSGAIMAVDGNLLKGTGKGEFEPGEVTGERDERVQRAIDDEIKVAIEAVRLLEAGHSFT